MRKTGVHVKTGSVDEFFGRVRGHAEKLDRGESLPAEITIAFEDPMELLNILTSERVRLLRRAKAGSVPISDRFRPQPGCSRGQPRRGSFRESWPAAHQLSRESRARKAQDCRARSAGIQVNCQLVRGGRASADKHLLEFLLQHPVPPNRLRRNFLNEGHGFAGCGKTHVLCQGTTLVGPKTARLMRATSPQRALAPEVRLLDLRPGSFSVACEVVL